jgi:hypothetical protein
MIADPYQRDWHISIFLSKDEAARQRQLLETRHGWGVWIGRDFVWHLFVTLTFAYPKSEAAALLHFGRWLRRVEQRAKKGVGWFVVLERGAAGLLHLHVLLVHTDHMHPGAVAKAWRCGRVDVTQYDPTRGAAYYLAKDVAADVLSLSHAIAPPHKLVRVAQDHDPVVAVDGAS